MHHCETCGHLERFWDEPMFGYCHLRCIECRIDYSCPDHTDFFNYEKSLWEPGWYNQFYSKEDRDRDWGY